ncbi:ABC transporter permease [Rhabdothermincola salaria]|uniref:ABC transporter permease n=1 Tax=Rhabdothermincola salaria TaxID=2903142 RepID=UPI001E3D10CC|nr:ABC transporter permease [Rhabdothermincola salaria]MCD9625543.1 ABC transporter permease [Rhabdothermincola salaria]
MSGRADPALATHPDLRPPGGSRATGIVAGSDLRRRIRNRSALLTAFAGPLVFAVVFSTLIGGATSSRFEVAVVDMDRSETSAAIVSGLLADDGGSPDQPSEDASAVTFTRLDGRAAAEAAVDDGEVDAAIVVPEGYEAAAQTPTPSSLVVLRNPGRTIAGQVAESVATSVAGRVLQVATAAALATDLTGTAPSADLLQAARDAASPLGLGQLDVDRDEISPAAYYGAAMSILFLFFTVGLAARSVLAERTDGTLVRLLSGPTPPGAVIAGKTSSVAALGLAGFVTVWVVTSVVFGAGWGNPAGVVVLMVATVIAIAGVATLVTSLARTPQQAESYTALVAFAFALLGGNFLGPGQLPGVLEQASLLTPNGWALRAFTELAAGTADPTQLATTVAVLVGFGVVFGTIGLARVHRLMAP